MTLPAMLWADLLLGARGWLGPAIGLAVLGLALVAWTYRTTRVAPGVRIVAALLKSVGIFLLAVCLVEPLWTGQRPRPGANLFLVVADNSRSLQLADRDARASRGELARAQLSADSPWLARLGQSFDVRRYVFDSHLRPVRDFSELPFDGQASSLNRSLAELAERYQGQPVAGILLLTDGNATDGESTALDVRRLPPVYPVALGADGGLIDLAVSRVTVSQTNFEAAPVTIIADIEGQGIAGRRVVVRVLDEANKEVERHLVPSFPEGQTLAQRFLLRPERPGVSFYTVQASLEGEESLDQAAGRSAEATLANNRRIATVDRGGGPYRVLYVSGRPNWEFKFLRRAIEADDEVRLVGLVRIAKREPKFTFLSRDGERTNPLFRGFGNKSDEQAEQYDQPVLIRLGTENPDELRGGFPKDAETLFAYQALVLDDVEAAYFTQDQMSLIQQFVGRRGGGLLMLGGKGSFGSGGYARTAVGELLPIYVDRTSDAAYDGDYRLKLTREGWLQPWIRLRSTESEEEQRLGAMPGFQTLEAAPAIKPGASVLAQVERSDGTAHPALVVQPFGRGRAAAMLIGDLWRWDLRRAESAESDLQKSWRQMVRWLVSDVPQPVEVETIREDASSPPGVKIVTRTRDKRFEPLDNATVAVRVRTPDQRDIELAAEASADGAGRYETSFVPRLPGAYRAQVVAQGPDGAEVGRRETGWAVEPESDEFRTLAVNRTALERLARDSGGDIVPLERLNAFVSDLPNRKIPVVETWTYPLWHSWSVLLAAVTCLVGEWGLRRWKGLP